MMQTMKDGIVTSLGTKGLVSPSAISTSASVSPSSTPEWWGVSPSYLDMASPSSPQISVEVLRNMCLPFIEQMLQNVQDGINAHLQQIAASDDVVDPPIAECGKVHAFAGLFNLPTVEINLDQRLNPVTSTMTHPVALDAATNSACAVTQKVHAGFDHGHVQRQQRQVMVWADEEPEVSRKDSENSASVQRKVMVCRHWKTKGFCRLGDECKFLHPDNKRGDEPADVPCESRSSRARRNNKRRGAAGATSTSE